MEILDLQSRKVICVLPIPWQTTNGEQAFRFLIMDVASKFILQADFEYGDEIEHVLPHIMRVLDSKDFNNSNMPFTLVMTKYGDYCGLIEHIIEPFNGTFLVDEQYVILKTASAKKILLSQINEGD